MMRTDAITGGRRGMRGPSDAADVERYRARPFTLVPAAHFIGIIDDLAADVAALERTVDQLRASNRRLADRRR